MRTRRTRISASLAIFSTVMGAHIVPRMVHVSPLATVHFEIAEGNKVGPKGFKMSHPVAPIIVLEAPEK